MPVVPGGLTAPTLPELVPVTCPECHGARFHEDISPLGVDHSRRCETCFGSGTQEVCGGCLEVPTVRDGADACACIPRPDSTTRCETCDRRVRASELADGICETCFAEGEAAAQDEPGYAAWKAEQLELGRRYGWL